MTGAGLGSCMQDVPLTFQLRHKRLHRLVAVLLLSWLLQKRVLISRCCQEVGGVEHRALQLGGSREQPALSLSPLLICGGTLH